MQYELALRGPPPKELELPLREADDGQRIGRGFLGCSDPRVSRSVAQLRKQERSGAWMCAEPCYQRNKEQARKCWACGRPKKKAEHSWVLETTSSPHSNSTKLVKHTVLWHRHGYHKTFGVYGSNARGTSTGTAGGGIISRDSAKIGDLQWECVSRVKLQEGDKIILADRLSEGSDVVNRLLLVVRVRRRPLILRSGERRSVGSATDTRPHTAGVDSSAELAAITTAAGLSKSAMTLIEKGRLRPWPPQNCTLYAPQLSCFLERQGLFAMRRTREHKHTPIPKVSDETLSLCARATALYLQTHVGFYLS